MKILFWLLGIASIAVGLFTSVVSYFAYGLDLAGTGFGAVVCMAGMLSALLCIVALVLGIRKRRKGDEKKALVFVLAGLLYCGIIFAGMAIDDAVYTVRLEGDIAQMNEELYGEGWDAPPAIDGIPELYQEVLNKYYAVVRDEWTDDPGDFGTEVMSAYYGDAPLENIGFLLTDLSGDGVDELIIGTTAAAASDATVIFCIYSDPANPFCYPSSFEGRYYYLHSGEEDGSLVIEISGMEEHWVIEPEQDDQILDLADYHGDALEPAGRMTLELIPFARYK